MLLIAFGVRQGCVIAPDAFATGMDWLLDASAALAWYPALVAARYFPLYGCLAHSVCGASVVGHVLGGGSGSELSTLHYSRNMRLFCILRFTHILLWYLYPIIACVNVHHRKLQCDTYIMVRFV